MWNRPTIYSCLVITLFFYCHPAATHKTISTSPGKTVPKYSFWSDAITAKDIKKQFDHFVASNGGVVDPAKNLPPKGFGSFKPNKEFSGRHKSQISRGKLIRHHHSYDKKTNDENDNFIHNRRGKLVQPHLPTPGPHGCEDTSGFHFEGDTWYSRGCRRHKCLHFRGKYFVETDSCDTEIYNTTYKCIIEVNLEEDYPNCCPKYICNPDNLGNRINV